MLTSCRFWRDVAVHLSFSNFFCDWTSFDLDLSTAPYDQKDLCVSYRTYTSVESLTTNSAGPLKRPSPSALASLHDITDSFTSCYKSHRLPLLTRPRLPHNVVLSTWLQDVVQSSSITNVEWLESLHWLSSRDVIIQWWSFDSIHRKTVFSILANAWRHL